MNEQSCPFGAYSAGPNHNMHWAGGSPVPHHSSPTLAVYGATVQHQPWQLSVSLQGTNSAVGNCYDSAESNYLLVSCIWSIRSDISSAGSDRAEGGSIGVDEWTHLLL